MVLIYSRATCSGQHQRDPTLYKYNMMSFFLAHELLDMSVWSCLVSRSPSRLFLSNTSFHDVRSTSSNLHYKPPYESTAIRLYDWQKGEMKPFNWCRPTSLGSISNNRGRRENGQDRFEEGKVYILLKGSDNVL